VGPLHADHGLVGAHGGGRRHHAVEHEVGAVLEQRPVFVGERLTFGAVGDDDRRPPAAGDGGHLATGRERGATPAPQPRAADLVDQAGADGR